MITVLMWIGFAILGALVLCTAAFGLMFLISKTAVEIAKHPADCQCGTCQGKRLRDWRARHGGDGTVIPKINQPRRPKEIDVKPKRSERWIPTLELRFGMYVAGGVDRSKTYRVESVEPTEFGFLVRLINASTRAKSVVLVRTDRAHRPMWLLIATENEG